MKSTLAATFLGTVNVPSTSKSASTRFIALGEFIRDVLPVVVYHMNGQRRPLSGPKEVTAGERVDERLSLHLIYGESLQEALHLFQALYALHSFQGFQPLQLIQALHALLNQALHLFQGLQIISASLILICCQSFMPKVVLRLNLGGLGQGKLLSSKL